MTVRIPSPPSDVRRVRQILRQQVSSLHHAQTGPNADERSVLRIRVPLPEVAPLSWLGAQPSDEKFYWAGRANELQIAGAGSADAVRGDRNEPYHEALRAVEDRMRGGDGELRYFGGFRFEGSPGEGPLWAPYGGYRFVLPRFELRRRAEETVLILNCVSDRRNGDLPRLLAEIDALRFPGEVDARPLPRAETVGHRPERGAWNRSVKRVLKTLSDSELRKAVLARRTTLSFSSSPDAVAVLRRLRRETPRCFHFLIQPRPGTAFLGASPERLYRRRGRSIRSEAVAGTRPRGEDPTTDERLREELLTSAKDRSEHYYVRRHLAGAAEELCERHRLEDELSVMSLATKHHLLSGLTGRLRERCTDAHVLDTLHPTPAVAGYPTREALELIGRLEPFDRGWYAGPVGWVGPSGAEFAVSIRSALLRERELYLFAGAGIVERSVGDEEWSELDQKIRDFTAFLGPEASPPPAG